MARRHARFGSSNAHRWLACPASPRLSEQAPPEIPSEAREEGTLAHEVLAVSLTQGAQHSLYQTHNVEFTEAIDFALEEIAKLRAHSMAIECYQSFPQDIVPEEQCGGTADVFGYGYTLERGAFVIDYKHGEGLLVEAEENEQSLFNATAAFWRVPVDRILTMIIQPRHWSGQKVRTWEITNTDLVEFHFRVEAALRAASDPNAPAIPGSHCQFCPAAVTCEARAKAGLAVVGLNDIRNADLLPTPEDLPLDALAHILENGAILTNWLNDVRKYAFDMATRRGVPIPGFKVVEAKPQRRFEGDPVETARKLAFLSCGQFEAHDFMPPTLLGIGEIEKMLRRSAAVHAAIEGIDEKQLVEAVTNQLAFLTTKASSGSLSLVPLSDPRPPINRALVFEGVKLPPQQE